MSNRTFNHLRLLHHVAVFIAKGVGDGKQHTSKTGSALHVVRGKVGTAVKRAPIWREKTGQRPATLSSNGLHCDLIAAVDVRALVTVNFDRDETIVDNLRGLWIFVRLAIHHMTPVAPDGADVEQDGLVLPLGRLERLFAPFVPLNGLVHGRAQVRGRSVRKGVEGFGGHDYSLTRHS